MEITNHFQKEYMFAYFNSEIELSINALIAGYEKCVPNKDLVFCNKPTFCLHFVLNGNGTLELNKKTYELHKNMCFFSPPSSNTIHRQDPQNPLEYIWIEFTGYDCKKLMSLTPLSIDNPVIELEITRLKKIDELLLKMVECINNQESFAFIEASGYLTLLIYNLILQTEKTLVIDKHSKTWLVKNAIEYIEKNFQDNNLNVAKVADILFINYSYLSRVFKELVGITMTTYISNTRLTKACELLQNEEYTILQVALQTGFSNEYYFSQCFKNRYKFPPSKFKKHIHYN